MLIGRSSSLPLCDCNVLNLIKLNYYLFIFALNGYLGELKVEGNDTMLFIFVNISILKP